MPEVRPLTPDDFDAVYSSFLASDDSRLTPDLYRPMFSPGVSLDDRCGLGLFSDGRIVGMLGTLFSRRIFNGCLKEVCNLHSWFVQPEFRGFSLLLMRPLLSRKDLTLTDFSSTPDVATISHRLGFQPLDGRLTLLWRTRNSASPRGVEIVTDRAQIRARTTTTDPTALQAIDDDTLQPVLLLDADGDCLMLARHVSRDCRAYCHLHHVSDAERFCRWSVPARQALLDLCGGAFVAVDRRHLGTARLPRRLTLPVSSRQLIRPGREHRGAIDTLRSELQYLGMTTLPEKRLYLKAIWSRLPKFGRRSPMPQRTAT